MYEVIKESKELLSRFEELTSENTFLIDESTSVTMVIDSSQKGEPRYVFETESNGVKVSLSYLKSTLAGKGFWKNGKNRLTDQVMTLFISIRDDE